MNGRVEVEVRGSLREGAHTTDTRKSGPGSRDENNGVS